MCEEAILVKEIYEESTRERLDYIRKINSENKIYQALRERNPENAVIRLVCQEILYENVRMIDYLAEGIEYDRAKIKELG